MQYLKIPNDKNKKSCDQNDETFWSHDLTKIEIAFEISCGDVDSLVIFVIEYCHQRDAIIFIVSIVSI